MVAYVRVVELSVGLHAKVLRFAAQTLTQHWDGPLLDGLSLSGETNAELVYTYVQTEVSAK